MDIVRHFDVREPSILDEAKRFLLLVLVPNLHTESSPFTTGRHPRVGANRERVLRAAASLKM